jgi:hypothetical protein
MTERSKGKYGALIQKAREPENQESVKPDNEDPKAARQKIAKPESQKAREPENQESVKPENQITSKPENEVVPEREVNLCVKVPESLRRHWAAESKRQGITMTETIVKALEERFGRPE